MSTGNGSFDPERFAQRMADESGRRDELIMNSLKLIATQVEGLQEDVRRGNLNALQAEQRFGQLEMQIMETREAVNLLKGQETEAVAKGATEGAMNAMKTVKSKLNRPQWFAVVTIGMVGLTTFIKEAPAIVRAVVAFFSGLMELDQ